MASSHGWLPVVCTGFVFVLGGPSPASGQLAPKGGRALGLHVNMPEDQNYDRAFQMAREAGAEVVTLHLKWADAEKVPGKPFSEYARVAEAFYPGKGARLHLSFNPIDTNRSQLPADLAGRRMNDPELIRRYCAALDAILKEMPSVPLHSLSVGNEVDAYLGAKEAAWRDYGEFFAAVRERLRMTKPGLPVGVALQFSTLAGPVPGPARRFARELAMAGDAAMVTYYPLNPDFSVRHPGSVQGDMEALLGAMPGIPVFLVEAGYPSSEVLRSSPARQRTFVEEAFRTWDRHRERLRLICFSWMHDITAASLDSFQRYYGVESRNFREYLATLGLRTGRGGGEDKPAFEALRKEARARGW